MRRKLFWLSIIAMVSAADLSFGADEPIEMMMTNPATEGEPFADDEPAPMQSFAAQLGPDAERSDRNAFANGLASANHGDFTAALKYWQPLAEIGHAAAQFNISLLYTYGRGVEQDLDHALWWSLPAAEQGYAPAQLKLGYMYAHGQGTGQKKLFALVWYNLAADSGQTPEGELAKGFRDRLAATMSTREIETATSAANRCKRSKAVCNHMLTITVAPLNDKSKVVLSKALTSHTILPSDYPPVSMRLQEQASVEIAYRIGKDGKIVECAVVDAQNKVRLAQAACTIVKRWLFAPATANDEPIPVTWWVGINFSLKRR